ncbi:uncharacterized protein K452DRAFT_221121 [Aplosporella prunicola CBS 121167]|uniref:Rhamnose mutarotase n=1 Tax=Aplosporella prunicola CBS 121167 TaxID=1176127 RepID=A0A6A6BQU1_9PEZI|nr:uncharacterized protein K452DRAFT_221121 [Aplosporella prunicola CBS 121167]KAF2145793.1 hypothetical protein K452DRAFT_221121 [Aplosporella prunicola CBS 121167]
MAAASDLATATPTAATVPATTEATGVAGTTKPVRVAQLVYLRPECLEEYKRCHAAVWPDVLAQIRDSGIRDYSIFLTPVPRPTLFATFKYVGTDWDADMACMGANERVRAWWALTDRMQESAVPGAKGSAAATDDDAVPPWWWRAEEVFYYEG